MWTQTEQVDRNYVYVFRVPYKVGFGGFIQMWNICENNVPENVIVNVNVKEMWREMWIEMWLEMWMLIFLWISYEFS